VAPVLAVAILLLLAACGPIRAGAPQLDPGRAGDPAAPTPAPPDPAATRAEPTPGDRRAGGREVVLATTTSVRDSGLLDLLVAAFERSSGYRVQTTALGTGAALAFAARGAADLVLTHAPEDERRWLAEGNGLDRRLVMYNDFVLLGPRADPAGVRALRDAREAFRRIAAAGAPFVSRGDQSGTHRREQALWRQAGLEPAGQPWYVESGAGQATTLTIADQRDAYVLTDRGTWLALRSRLQLDLLVEGDPQLLNLYHVMRVNPAKFPGLPINLAGATALAEFLLGPEGQRLIGEFGREQHGRPLFTPAAGLSEADLIQ
jgi:tungstate transport system substrate-binding protein